MVALDTARNRLAAVRARGLPVPDGLDDATPAEVDRALRGLARARLADHDAQIDAPVRERAALAATAIDPPHDHA